MGTATVLIGLLPNFASIGWLAPVLLVLLRAIQGFAVGGEWGGAALMAVESAPKGRKALYSSGIQIGYGVGLMLATGSVSLVIYLFGQDAFADWAWRIPFLASIILVLFALWVRGGQEESTRICRKCRQSETTACKNSIV
jgi:MHS family shikimate/dehydroshikimate transporter-like MFS transporter